MSNWFDLMKIRLRFVVSYPRFIVERQRESFSDVNITVEQQTKTL